MPNEEELRLGMLDDQDTGCCSNKVKKRNMDILHYRPNDADLWNEINRRARNGHLLFDRGFMDYHSDRFADCSVIIRDEDTPIALLPANRVADTVYSHQGLTFGGLVLSDRATTSRVMRAFDAMLAHFASNKVSKLIYKVTPSIYHSRPASEDLYALFRLDARLIRRDVSTTVDYRHLGPVSSRRSRGARKANKSGITFGESDQWQAFWDILMQTLSERHSVAPVHSLSEIQLLASRFPDAIRLFVAIENQAVVAGTVMFETATVAHAQYISSSPQGRQTGALDGLFEYVLQHYQDTKRFFDFGISTEEGGRKLNEGLLTQKEEFGGSAIVHDVYELTW